MFAICIEIVYLNDYYKHETSGFHSAVLLVPLPLPLVLKYVYQKKNAKTGQCLTLLLHALPLPLPSRSSFNQMHCVNVKMLKSEDSDPQKK